MKKMNLLPTDPKVRKLSNIQWTVLYKLCRETEKEDFQKYALMLVTILGKLLGVKFGDKDEIMPLTAFINPDVFNKLMEEFELTEDIDENEPNEEMDFEMQNVFETDIDAMLSDEELRKVDSIQIEEMEKLEDMIGVLRGVPKPE